MNTSHLLKKQAYSRRSETSPTGRLGPFLLAFVLATAALVHMPVVGALDVYPVLRDCFDPKLQNGLERVLVDLGLDGAANRKTFSVALVDITNLKHPRVAAINGNQMVYAASLPKLAILLGVFKEIEAGKMTLDPKTRQTLTDMIRHSSNTAASEMMRRVGPERIAEILQTPDCQLYDPEKNGGLWCGKEYGRAKAWKRDPLNNLSHGATALQAARFYYLLETQQLVSPKLSQEMKTILADPGIEHKFVRGMKRRPGAKLYRKSGTWHTWHADSAMIEYGDQKYIVAALAEDRRGGQWLEKLIVPLHDLIVKQPKDASPP
ncbi:MAG: serine hydrolase [Desulfobacterales bacterium]|jgi:beta-lactamase class A